MFMRHFLIFSFCLLFAIPVLSQAKASQDEKAKIESIFKSFLRYQKDSLLREKQTLDIDGDIEVKELDGYYRVIIPTIII
ncbi:MAG: hypothetical protein AAF549_03700, partial [Pseudomonadota bacterium]